jgi:nucleoside-diphosphate-sugar epimerase
VTGQTALLTGASGALGRHLVSALKHSGWRVRALVHGRPVHEADELVHGDLLDSSTLEAGVEGVHAVVHAAAVAHARDPARYVAVNVVGTEALVASAADAGVERLVLVSTRALGPGGGAYSDSKRRAEEVVRAGRVPWTIVRLPEVYGAGGREGIDRMIASARANRLIPILGTGLDRVSPVYIDDAVVALVRALSAPEALGRTYTLAAPELTLREVAEACCEAFGSRGRIVSVSASVVRTAARLSRFLPLPVYPDQLDRLRAARPGPSPEAETDLGFRPRSFDEGLRRVQELATPGRRPG